MARLRSTPAATRILTELDEVRLRKLRESQSLPEEIEDALDDLFDEADLIDARSVKPDVVTMHSRIRVANLLESNDATKQAQTTHVWTLGYPANANLETGCISVLSPVGLALLGRRVGQKVHYITPDGRDETLIVEAIEYQPEANGEFTL